MSNKFYMIATFVLIVIIAGFFVVKPLLNKESSSSQTVIAEDLGDYQKAVLSLKNYNYYPNSIEVVEGKPVRIYLDDSVQGCYRSFTLKDFNVAKLVGPNDYVEFTPNRKGTFQFACSMGMGNGKLIVK